MAKMAKSDFANLSQSQDSIYTESWCGYRLLTIKQKGEKKMDTETKVKDPMTHSEKITASDNFIMYLSAVRQQLDELSTMVNDHFGYSVDEIHWGHTGTVQHIYEQLTEIMASLDGFVRK